MAWSAADIPDLKGKIAVVTGGNSGLGYETALELAVHGAQTIIACRDAAKATRTLEQIRSGRPKVNVEAMSLDLASLASIRAFSTDFHDRFKKLDLLVNNAGVMAIPRRNTADGFEMQFGTNHLGHFALTGLLLDRVVASGIGRIVNVSSMVHKFGRMQFDDLQGDKRYRKWAAYGQSKLANLLFTSELQKRLEAAGLPVISAAAHPGYAATNLQAAGPTQSGSWLGALMARIGNSLFAQSAAMGALPTLYAATARDVKGNEYFGPSGLFEQRGPPKRVGRSLAAQSAADARTLWERSVILTGVSYYLLPKPAELPPAPEAKKEKKSA